MPPKKSAKETKISTSATSESDISSTEPTTSRASEPSSASSAEARSERRSRSKRAGILFPVGRIHKLLKKGKYAKRISETAPVFLAAALNYLVNEVCDMAATAAIDNRKKRISPRHITMAIRKDDELNELLKDVTIAQGGVMPNIHPVLLPKITAEKNKGVKKKSDRMHMDQNEE